MPKGFCCTCLVALDPARTCKRCGVCQAAYYARWKQENREKFSRSKTNYYRQDIPRQRAWAMNHIAKRHKVPGTLTGDDIRDVFAAAQGRCSYCRKRRFLTVDHMIPLSRGGANTRANLTAACRPCNSGKKRLTPEEWSIWKECRDSNPLPQYAVIQPSEQTGLRA